MSVKNKNEIVLPRKLVETIFAQMVGIIEKQKLRPEQLRYICAYYDTYTDLKEILGRRKG